MHNSVTYKMLCLAVWACLLLPMFSMVHALQSQDVECKRKDIPLSTSFVCECNATYCDTIQAISVIPAKTFISVTSNKNDLRFAKMENPIAAQPNNTDKKYLMSVNSSDESQTIVGFGGAFTDSATMNILNISSNAQENLLRSYFSTDGIEYTTGRIPIASCDFSLGEYSYDDFPNDFSLSNFSLANVDLKFKIPIIKRALNMSKVPLKLFAAPWSAPAWMKTNKHMNGKGQLLGKAGDKYHKTYADYYVRFLDAYKQHNISMWGLSVQNEPSTGGFANPFQAMYYSAEMMCDFIKMDLGPALQKAGYRHIKLMMLDDQTLFLPDFPQKVLSDPDAAQYISAIAIHWYLNAIVDFPPLLRKTHDMFPNTFLLATEACNGFIPLLPHVVLGSWERGEKYSFDIMQDLNNWVTGWTDWNLALNMQGGPNWAKNFVDSPIIVDAERDVFYKQPMYYHFGHFSKFIPPGSVHVGLTTSKDNDLDTIAFKLPDGKTFAVVIMNKLDKSKSISIHEPSSGYINAVVTGRSIQTFLWNAGK